MDDVDEELQFFCSRFKNNNVVRDYVLSATPVLQFFCFRFGGGETGLNPDKPRDPRFNSSVVDSLQEWRVVPMPHY